MTKIILFLISFYQKYLSFDKGMLAILAPGGACKYSVSCSEYMIREIRAVGVVRGIILGFRRIISCR